MKQVVAGLIVRDRKLLICQRTKHQALPLKWEFPGGKIESGEEPVHALQRELEEELGIAATVGPKIYRTIHTYKNGNAVELHFFLVSDYSGDPENRIFRDIRWVRVEELPEYDFLDADRELVRDLAASKISLKISA